MKRRAPAPHAPAPDQPHVAKTLRGYADHARFLATCDECTSGDGTAALVGWWRSANGNLVPVHKWRLRFVAIVDAGGIRKHVLVIPSRDVITEPECGHSACRQHFVDTGEVQCIAVCERCRSIFVDRGGPSLECDCGRKVQP